MSRKLVRCPYGGHYIQVEIKDGYVVARALPQDRNLNEVQGHNQVCPICNRPIFIEYVP